MCGSTAVCSLKTIRRLRTARARGKALIVSIACCLSRAHCACPRQSLDCIDRVLFEQGAPRVPAAKP